MKRWLPIAALALAGCAPPSPAPPPPDLLAPTVTGAYAPPAGPCDIAAAAGTPCVAATSLARPLLASYAGSLYQTSASPCTFTEFYDQMGTPATGNNLTVDLAFGKAPAPCGSTTLPNGKTVPIARIVVGEGYYQGTCCNGGGTVGMPQGNNSITILMVIEDNSEGGGVDGCCAQVSDSESPTMAGVNGSMFGTAWSLGGEGTFGTGTGPWPGIDLENGVFMYGPTPTARYLVVLAKYDASAGTMTLKSGDATQGPLTTLYSGPLPPGYTKLALQGGYSLGRGGDGSSAPVNIIEWVVIAAATSDATDNAVEQNIINFFGAA